MKHHFVVCIDNTSYEASLESGKIYQQLPDDKAFSRGLIRVVDESGEDYLFEGSRFVNIDLPEIAENALFATA